ncbi:uncharacterized protein LOC117107553 [Anneissia japonica]|uniref:uncharacterized protein LOC117107553 n=1 Tax=Anneissia japonica TaxID=1529436 RepID=UPI001425A4A1|nr:uncharacterized protein LOC117107553 [Anneissia japonica]
MLGVSGELSNYTMKTCNGERETKGRNLSGLIVESLDGATKIEAPSLLECAEIPGNMSEIATPEVAMAFPHLKSIAGQIPPLNKSSNVLLLLGRDVPQVHKVRETRNGPNNAPGAQRLDLGWVVVGEVCLNGVHRPKTISTLRTQVLITGRPTTLQPCPNTFQIHTLFDDKDDFLSLSVEERKFLEIMEKEGGLRDGKWTAPLPFKKPRERLPNNREQAWSRAQILRKSMDRNPLKTQHMLDFMDGVINKGHAEVAPPLKNDEECWFLPLFGVYDPKKKDKIRGVFDSSATFCGLSLNKVLLKGPDFNNDLVGVLMRFRKQAVAVSADVESMFYCFEVAEKHRNFLRFFWYADNDYDKPLIEYRMRKHVFGNSPSPAVACFGLRDVVKDSEPDVREFVNRHFYVDDDLVSCKDSESAISLLKRTKQVLMQQAQINLHKIASNSQMVLDAFAPVEIVQGVRDFNVCEEDVPLQRTLGVQWRLRDDMFTFNIDLGEEPYTKLGMLSTINGVFDPLGFVAPVMIQARVLFRKMITSSTDWDEELAGCYLQEWKSWKNDLKELQNVSVPRAYPLTFGEMVGLHVFCDASEVAVAAVAYLVSKEGEQRHTGLVFGKSRLAPKAGHNP